MANPAFKLSQLVDDSQLPTEWRALRIDIERLKRMLKAFKATGDQELLNLFFARPDVAALIWDKPDVSTIIGKVRKLGWGSSLEVLIANPALNISIKGPDPLQNLELFLGDIKRIKGHEALAVRTIEGCIPKIRTGLQLHRILKVLEEILVSNPTELALRTEALFENPTLNLSQIPNIFELREQAERIIKLKEMRLINPETTDRVVKRLIMDSVNLIETPFDLKVIVKSLLDLRRGDHDWVSELLGRIVARSESMSEAMKLLSLFARTGLFDQGFESLEYWYQRKPGWKLKQSEWITKIHLVEDLQVRLLILDRALNNKDSLIYEIFHEKINGTWRFNLFSGGDEPGVYLLEFARDDVLKKLAEASIAGVGPFHRASISKAGAGAGAGSEEEDVP